MPKVSNNTNEQTFQVSILPIYNSQISIFIFQIFKLSHSNFKVSDCPFSNFQILKFPHVHFQTPKNQIPTFQTVWYIDLPRFSELQILRCENNIFQGYSHNCSCIFWSIFGDEYEARGSIFGHIFGRSRHPPKRIAIDQDSLISHLGINKTPKKP